MYKLVLIRHGESTWNLENRFTGWTDVDLTPTGVSQAMSAGKLLKAEGYAFDLAYTSVLKRAIHTLWYTLDEMDCTWLPVVKDWRLNERHYGALQGLNKADMAKQYGDAQVLVWRRSYDTPPPALEATDPRCERGDRRYAALNPTDVPLTECLKDTVARVLPFWNESMAPAIKAGERVCCQKGVQRSTVDRPVVVVPANCRRTFFDQRQQTLFCLGVVRWGRVHNRRRPGQGHQAFRQK